MKVYQNKQKNLPKTQKPKNFPPPFALRWISLVDIIGAMQHPTSLVFSPYACHLQCEFRNYLGKMNFIGQVSHPYRRTGRTAAL